MLRPGAATPAAAAAEPVVLVGVSGTTSIMMTGAKRPLGREQIASVPRGSTYRLRNSGSESAVVLVQSLKPAQ